MESSLIVALILGLSASTLTPLVLGYLQARTRRIERDEDRVERALVVEAAEKATHKVEEKIEEVHTIVNSQRTEMRQYIEQLTDALRSAGVDVPHDNSLGEL